MSNYFQGLYKKYRNKGILIDTNIFILLIVGTVNRERIAQFNRTEKFTAKDYDVLLNVFQYFTRIIITPHILTEVNSLTNQLKEPERSQALSILAETIVKSDKIHEEYRESSQIVQVENFTKFGLTDCGIMEVSKDRYLVLTDDLRLSDYLQRKYQIDVINFTHIQGQRLLQ